MKLREKSKKISVISLCLCDSVVKKGFERLINVELIYDAAS